MGPVAEKTYQVQFIQPQVIQTVVSEYIQQTWNADENDHLRAREILALCAANYRQVAQELEFLSRFLQCAPVVGGTLGITIDNERNLYLTGDGSVLGGHPSVLVPGQWVEDPSENAEDGSEIWMPD